MNKDVNWTPALIARLQELHAEGLSFEKITARMNLDFSLVLTRNACIGKARRAHFPVRASTRAPAKPRPPPKPKVVIIKKPRPRSLPAAAAQIYGPIDMSLGPRGTMQLLQLSDNACSWPTGIKLPYSYCGKETVHGSPYCREHYDRAHRR